nr:MAG TPA: hypothetical protein [Caudoviricetes sp.]
MGSDDEALHNETRNPGACASGRFVPCMAESIHGKEFLYAKRRFRAGL